MKRLFPFCLLGALLSGATAAAQPTFRLGLRGGANRATTTLDAGSTGSEYGRFFYGADKSAIYAWQTGAVLEIAFRRFAVQPALLFSQKGEELHTHTYMDGVAGANNQDTRRVSRSNWLELPVNVVYTVHGVQFFAGPYVALAVGGRERSTTLLASPYARYAPIEYDGKLFFGPDAANRRFDAGFNAGVGYRCGPVQVQLGYGLGLLNLRRAPVDVISEFPFHDFGADPARHRVVQLTGTYFFQL